MRIGIVGFGVVGKSVLTFLASEKGQAFIKSLAKPNEPITIDVWDKKNISDADCFLISQYSAHAISAAVMTLGEFVTFCDKLMVSPGVNISRYKLHAHKFLVELDIFNQFFKKPTIAITGSLGKTTITKLLGAIIEKLPEQQNNIKNRVVLGGNIGLGMLDLVGRQGDFDAAILEVSSFQLELNQQWAPDIAIWTNCYPNHLDRHETLQAYFDAKCNILRFQRENQRTLLSTSLLSGDVGLLLRKEIANIKSQLYFFDASPFNETLLQDIPNKQWACFNVFNGRLVLTTVVNNHISNQQQLCDISCLPPVTFIANWVPILGALHILGIDLAFVESFFKTNNALFTFENEHRCEFVATIKGVDFYNDSKATVIQSTEAAVRKLVANERPIILILGGLGKGVDRSPLAASLKNIHNIKQVFCVGKECSAFAHMSVCLPSLDQAMAEIAKIMEPGDQVLFSPGGTSFDFYENYEHRGRVFKEMVSKLI